MTILGAQKNNLGHVFCATLCLVAGVGLSADPVEFRYTITARGTQTVYPTENVSVSVGGSVQATYNRWTYVMDPFAWCYNAGSNDDPTTIPYPATYQGFPRVSQYHPGGDGACARSYNGPVVDNTSQWFGVYQKNPTSQNDSRSVAKNLVTTVSADRHGSELTAKDIGVAADSLGSWHQGQNWSGNPVGWWKEARQSTTYSLFLTVTNSRISALFSDTGTSRTSNPLAHVLVYTTSSTTNLWSDEFSAQTSISVDDGPKLVATSTLVAPNSDTSWTVSSDNSNVRIWNVGNQIWAELVPVPTIDLQPDDRAVIVGHQVEFSGVALGNGTLTYQWLHEGEALVGATNDTYVIESAALVDTGNYQVVVKIGEESVNSRVANLQVLEPELPRSGIGGFDGPVNAIWPTEIGPIVGGAFEHFVPIVSHAGLMTLDGQPDLSWPRFGGAVVASVSDGSGGWFIAWSNAAVFSVSHVLSDGLIDEAFSSVERPVTAAGRIHALALSGDRLYVAGNFDGIKGAFRNGLASLDTVTGEVSPWNPEISVGATVLALEVAPDGESIFAGGEFSAYSRINLARISVANDAAMALDFQADANNLVRTIEVAGGDVWVGGDFNNIGGHAVGKLAKLSLAGTVQTDFKLWAAGSAGGQVRALHCAAGVLYVGGSFSYFTVEGGSPLESNRRTNLAAIANNVLTEWEPGANGAVNTIESSGDSVLVGGSFNVIDGVPRNFAARLRKDGNADYVMDFHPNVENSVCTISVDGNRVVLGGDFRQFARIPCRNLAWLNEATGLPTPWRSEPNGPVTDIWVRREKLYVAGRFTEIEGVSRGYWAEFQLDGSDPLLSPLDVPVTDFVEAMAFRGGSIFLGGRAGIVEVELGSGTQGLSLSANEGGVAALCVAGDHLFAGGDFASLGGISSSRFVGWDLTAGQFLQGLPQPDAAVHVLAFDGTELLLGGLFGELIQAGVPNVRSAVASISVSDYRLTSWAPGIDGPRIAINAMESARDHIYLGGDFRTVGGRTHRDLTAVDRTGNPVSNNGIRILGDGAVVNTLARRAGTLYVGGGFDGVFVPEKGEIATANFAILGPNGPPANLMQSVDRAVTEGDPVVLETDVYGQSPISFQWFKDGVALVNQIGERLELGAVGLADSGLYSVVVSNTLGVISNVVSRVDVAPKPEPPPPGGRFDVVPGTKLVLNAQVEPGMSVQWFRNDVHIAGAVGAQYVITNAQIVDSGTYKYRLRNAFGIAEDSPPFNVFIRDDDDLIFADDFDNRVALSGGQGIVTGDNHGATREAAEPPIHRRHGNASVWFSWTAESTGPVRFSTLGSGIPTVAGVFINPPGNSSLFGLDKLESDRDSGTFDSSEFWFRAIAGTEYVVGLDSVRRREGALVLSWKQLADQAVPVVRSVSGGGTIRPGQADAVFAATLESANSVSLQWYLGSTPISGATNATFTISNPRTRDLGEYRLRASIGEVVVWKKADELEFGEGGVVSIDRFGDLFRDAARSPAGLGGSVEVLSAGLIINRGELRQQTLRIDEGSVGDQFEPVVARTGLGNTRWLTFTPSANGTIIIHTSASSFDPAIAVYTGDQLQSLRLEASDRNGFGDGQNAQLQLQVTAGRTYLLVVDREDQRTGVATINLRMGEAPVVKQHPISGIFVDGAAATFVFDVSGDPVPQIQWYKNGQAISGATNATYTVTHVTAATEGQYHAVAQNLLDFVTSTSAQLVLNELILGPVDTSTENGQLRVSIRVPTDTPVTIEMTSNPNLTNWSLVETLASSEAEVKLVIPLPSDVALAYVRARYEK